MWTYFRLSPSNIKAERLILDFKSIIDNINEQFNDETSFTYKDVMREISDDEEQENKIPEAQEFFSNREESDARISETITAVKNFEKYKNVE